METNNTPTPGPWIIEKHSSGMFPNDIGGRLIIRAEDLKKNLWDRICEVPTVDGYNRQETMKPTGLMGGTPEANAKLIAAAPELLDALEMMLAWANIKDGSPSQHIRDIAQDVIKKATKP